MQDKEIIETLGAAAPKDSPLTYRGAFEWVAFYRTVDKFSLYLSEIDEIEMSRFRKTLSKKFLASIDAKLIALDPGIAWAGHLAKKHNITTVDAMRLRRAIWSSDAQVRVNNLEFIIHADNLHQFNLVKQ